MGSEQPVAAGDGPSVSLLDRTWFRWLLALVVIVAVVGAVLYFSQGEPKSEFVYDDM